MNTLIFQTKQKADNLPQSNFDFSHKNYYTCNPGELIPSMCLFNMPKDDEKGSVSQEILLPPLENPSFTDFKMVNKSFYIPICEVWKYFNQFFTNKADTSFPNKELQQLVNDRKPFREPYIYYYQILPIIAFAKGYIANNNSKICYAPLNYENSAHTNYDYDVANDDDLETYAFGKMYASDTYYIDKTLYCTHNTDGVHDGYTNLACNDINDDIPQDYIPFFKFYIEFDYDLQRSSYTSKPASSIVYSNETIIEETGKNYTRVNPFNLTYLKLQPANNQTGHTNFRNQRLYYNGNYGNGYFILPLPSAQDASKYGMTQLAFLHYLCVNATKLLDMLGYPTDLPALSTSYDFNAIKDIKLNLLPLMSYQKIYQDHFKNPKFQVINPFYEELNGAVLGDITDTESNTIENNSAVLHFDNIPYAQKYDLCDYQIRILCQIDLMRLLLGININYTLSNQNNQRIVTMPYLPNYTYYNGLLHLQFTNYQKDYFSSCIHDPLAGADDIAIPSTITELKEKTKLQDFLNSTAWSRGLKEFLENHFDSFSKYTQEHESVYNGTQITDIQIGQVLQSSETTENSLLGKRAGIGQGYGNGGILDLTTGEFGYTFIISYIVFDQYLPSYLDKKLLHKESYLDYPLPELANLGNQSVQNYEVNGIQISPYTRQNKTRFAYFGTFQDFPSLDLANYSELNKEISDEQLKSFTNVDGYASINYDTTILLSPETDIFGYIPRYSEFKYIQDAVHGQFKDKLKNWVSTRELNGIQRNDYFFNSYELQFMLANTLKNFANSKPLENDLFYINQTNILNVRRSLPLVVDPKF